MDSLAQKTVLRDYVQLNATIWNHRCKMLMHLSWVCIENVEESKFVVHVIPSSYSSTTRQQQSGFTLIENELASLHL